MDSNTEELLPDGWHRHPETVPDTIDKEYRVRLTDGQEANDFFTGFNWYWYDYTEIIAWKEL